MKSRNFLINNIDINVITERPRIDKYRNKIINSISKLCNIDKNKINIKENKILELKEVVKNNVDKIDSIIDEYNANS